MDEIRFGLVGGAVGDVWLWPATHVTSMHAARFNTVETEYLISYFPSLTRRYPNRDDNFVNVSRALIKAVPIARS